ncbi:hypothetical protein DM2_2361 [Halorubrum sp. DM2]|nr:hypothetical protein DM2_2361 [Halorubrum sp. DM2]
MQIFRTASSVTSMGVSGVLSGDGKVDTSISLSFRIEMLSG